MTASQPGHKVVRAREVAGAEGGAKDVEARLWPADALTVYIEVSSQFRSRIPQVKGI
jgi:hypothetical protein